MTSSEEESQKVRGVEVIEAFTDYKPPIRAGQTVKRLLLGIPEKYLAGLKTIVITDSAMFSHDDRRRRVKSRNQQYLIAECRGFYHQKKRGEPAWIRLLLDNMLRNWPIWLLRIQFFRDLAIADVLFHEVGHHIYETKVPQHKDMEKVADRWSLRLTRKYFWKRYWYLRPLLLVLNYTFRSCRAVKRKWKKLTK